MRGSVLLQLAALESRQEDMLPLPWLSTQHALRWLLLRRAMFPQAYDFSPRTFLLPEMAEAFAAELAGGAAACLSDWFPSQGRGLLRGGPLPPSWQVGCYVSHRVPVTRYACRPSGMFVPSALRLLRAWLGRKSRCLGCPIHCRQQGQGEADVHHQAGQRQPGGLAGMPWLTEEAQKKLTGLSVWHAMSCVTCLAAPPALAFPQELAKRVSMLRPATAGPGHQAGADAGAGRRRPAHLRAWCDALNADE